MIPNISIRPATIFQEFSWRIENSGGTTQCDPDLSGSSPLVPIYRERMSLRKSRFIGKG
jgi:hypothetical protein